MSEGGTNTPNGDSKDLFSKNEDIDKIELTVTDVTELNPLDKGTGIIPGDNTITEASVRVDPGTMRLGVIKIGVTPVGQPMKYGPESENIIKLSIEEVKRTLQARGAMTADAYIKAKEEAIAAKKALEEKEEDRDKNE